MPSALQFGTHFEVEYLVVAGGGGGGSKGATYQGGGGGAGGLLFNNNFIPDRGSQYTITVGAGGVGGTPDGVVPTSGSNSVFHNIESFGGGRGYSRTIASVGYDATSGGSGGGQGGGSSTRFLGITGQGNSGGALPSAIQAGGGGGADTAALLDYQLFNTRLMNGGNGRSITVTGTSVIYAGGGGGADDGLGGTGGGGRPLTATASNGAINSGSGGGGGQGSNSPLTYGQGGNGGSGIVILAYKTTFPSASIGAGLTFSYSTSLRSGYHVYQFTGGTGTITFN